MNNDFSLYFKKRRLFSIILLFYAVMHRQLKNMVRLKMTPILVKVNVWKCEMTECLLPEKL